MRIYVHNNTGEVLTDFGYYLLDIVKENCYNLLDSNSSKYNKLQKTLDTSLLVTYTEPTRAIDIVSVFKQGIENLILRETPKMDLLIYVDPVIKIYGTSTGVETFIKFFEYGINSMKLSPMPLFRKVFDNIEKNIYNYYEDWLEGN
jgi:hypothetical protein